MYAIKGDYQRAIRDLDQAIGLNPSNAKHYNNRGIAYWSKGEYDLAISDLETALQLAQASGEKKLAKNIQSRLELYKAKRPGP